MELPAYHLPTVGSVLRSMWERGWSFIKKAGTIILLLYYRNLVCNLLWSCRRQVPDALRGSDRLQHPCHDRKRNQLALYSAGLGQLAGSCGFYHRTCRKGEHRWYTWYPLRWRQMEVFMQRWLPSLPQLPDTASWHSTFCVHRASQQWVQSNVR